MNTSGSNVLSKVWRGFMAVYDSELWIGLLMGCVSFLYVYKNTGGFGYAAFAAIDRKSVL